MTTEQLYRKALALATAAHQGQTDKAGQPYIGHPLRVAARCGTTEAKAVALLHDVLEDTPVTAEALEREGFPPRIVEAVVALTRAEGEKYADYVRRAARNPLGREVKTHDLEDNMDAGRLRDPGPADFARLRKYRHCHDYLTTGDESALDQVVE